jgi:hypothetical protein
MSAWRVLTGSAASADFGPCLALTDGMNDHKKLGLDENDWRKLCRLVADERDPHRLSQLLDQLLKELDARRQALRRREEASRSNSGDI